MYTALTKYTGSIIAIILLCGVAFGSAPQTAQAQAGAAGCGASVGIGAGAAAAASAITVPTFDLPQIPQTMKECLFDGIVVLIREALIEVLVTSIVQWINTGFQGNPAFITNLDAFLIGVADRAAGAFIESTELGFLCSPFELEVRIALALEYFAPFSNRISCTLTDVVENTQEFLNGNFSEGGWRGWFEVSTKPRNNPYGGYLIARRELEVRIQGEQDREIIQANWSSGFENFETCRERPPNPSDPTSHPGQQECVTGTPGTVINQQLNWTLSSGQRQLELADEVDEIIGALLGQLTKQVLTGVGGLLGTSQTDYGGSSYLDRIRAEQDVRVTGRKAQVEDYISSQINSIRSVETRYGNAKKSAHASVTAAEQAVSDLRSCYVEKLERDEENSSFLTQEEAEAARARRDAADATLDSDIEPRREALADDIARSGQNIDAIDNLQQNIAVDMEEVKTALELQNVLDDFNNSPLFRTGSASAVHSLQDAVNAEQQRDSIQSEMSTIQSDAEEKTEICNAFPEGETSNGAENGAGQ